MVQCCAADDILMVSVHNVLLCKSQVSPVVCGYTNAGGYYIILLNIGDLDL